MELKQMGNPANRDLQVKAERTRIPMSVPVQKLQIPEVPGYHLHWFRTEPGRIERAMQAGYEYVRDEELSINAVGLGMASAISGNSDLGSNVSVPSGTGKDGNPIRLVLMKIKQEWYEEDQAKLDEVNAQTASAIVGGMVGAENESSADARQRYIDKTRTQIPNLFKPKRALS